MAGISLEFDATGSAIGGGNPNGTAYALSSANGYELLAFEAPEPEEEIQWASSADTEGERKASSRPRNRTVTIRVRLTKSTDALVEAEFNSLGKKVGKLRREGGTLKFTAPSGTVGYFDIQSGGHAFPWEHRLVRNKRGEPVITLVCDPYIRGAQQSISLGTPISTAGGVHVWVPAAIPGDVDALGTLNLTDSSGASQFWLTWGLETNKDYTHTTTSGSGALFYEAEGRTAMGGSSVVTGPSGASGGASNNVMRNTSLTGNYQAILSTQATGAGAHLSHVGTFRVYARVQVPTTNTGLVTVALEWSEGDFLRYSRNNAEATTIPSEQEGRWLLLDLGLVSVRKVVQGTQRWEGRIVAKSTVFGDDIDIDYLFLVPANDGSGVASGVIRDFTPTSFVARDEFTGTTAGNALNGRVAPVGGTWATSGGATDLTFIDPPNVFDSEAIGRIVGTDRFAILGSTDYTNITVSARIGNTGAVIARWTDSNNFLRAAWYPTAGGDIGSTNFVEIVAFVGGVQSVIAVAVPLGSQLPDGATMTMTVLANGYVRLAFTDAIPGTGGTLPDFVIDGWSSVLATGGTLATGKIGVAADPGSGGLETQIDDFWAAVPPLDAAMFASQSLELRHDRIDREDSGGTIWTPLTSYEGDYLRIKPAGVESRTARIIAKGSRLHPELADVASDLMAATLNVTPRFLAFPD